MDSISTEVQPISIGSRVLVCWYESNSRYPGSVQSINADGSFNVLYDELVDGKMCLEQGVVSDRVSALSSDDYWVDCLSAEAETAAGTNVTTEVHHGVSKSTSASILALTTSSEQSRFVGNLLNHTLSQDQITRPLSSLNGDDDDDDDGDGDRDGEVQPEEADENLYLTNAEAALLHDSLTNAKVMELLAVSHDRAEWLNSLLTARILSNVEIEEQRRLSAMEVSEEQQSAYSLVANWNKQEKPIDTNSKMLAWLRSASQPDDSLVQSLTGSLLSLAALIRFTAAANILQSRQTLLQSDLHVSAEFVSSLNVAEEMVLQILQMVLIFLQQNFLIACSAANLEPETAQEATRSPSKALNMKAASGRMVHQSRRPQKSKTSNLLQHAMSQLGALTFPAISSVLDALTVLLGDAKQSDRLLAITCDLCFAILRLDPATQPSLAQLSVQGPGVLTSLQHAASRHLRSVYMTFESHRQSIIVSSLSAILDAYTVKSPTKNFIMHHSAHTEFSGRVKKPRYRSATRSSSRQNASTFSLMTLLSCIQSATNLKAFSESSDETLKQQPAKGKSSKKNTGNGDARSDTDELSSRELLRDCYQGAFHFAVELLKRCAYKDASGEYRSVTMLIAEELMTILPMPDWPIVSVVIEQIVLRASSYMKNPEVLYQLGDATDVTATGRKDSSLATFLMDLLAKFGRSIRELNFIAETEHSATENLQFTPQLKGTLRRKFLSMKADWLPLEEEGEDEEAAQDRSNETAASAEKINVMTGLQILMDVSNAAMEVVVEQPLNSCYAPDESEGLDCSSLSRNSSPFHGTDRKWSSAGLIPTPLNILEQVGQQKDLLRMLPNQTTVDFFYQYIASYLLQRFSTSLPSCDQTVQTANDAKERQWMELGTYLELCEDRLKDAYIFLLALWHQDTCRGRRKEVSAYTANALRAIARIEDKMSEKTSTECAPSWRKLSDGLINLFYHRKSQRHYSDNFWGKHMCLIEESLAANRHVINLRLLRVCFERVLSEILHKSSDPVPAIRARVIKALSSFLSVDPDVLLREVVHGVVANKLKDRAISVREEAVKLVGSFIMSTAVTEASTSKLLTTGTRDEMPTKIVLSEYYLEDLKFCLHDEGISVRKSVVGLFKDILLSQPDHPQFMRLCLSLLEKLAHPKEEDSIKEIIRSTLQQIFFLPPSSEQLLVSFNRKHNSPRQLHMDSPADGANEGDEKHMQTTPRERKCEEHLQMSSAVTEVPGIMRTQSADIISSEFRSTPENNAVTLPSVDADNPRSTTLSRNKSSSEDDLLRHHVESTSLQLVEMACSTTQQPQHNIAFENSIHEWLINLLREVLHGTSEGEEMQRQAKQRRASCFHYCQRILDNLIEQLLRTEEQERVLVCLLEKKGLQPKDYVVNLIGTIALFCEAHPPFIAGHLTTLIPYLKRDTSHSLANNSYISLRVTEILCSVSVLKEVRIRFEMGEVLQDLSNIALNYGSKNTRSAIKCIALLTAHMGNDASYFFNLGSKCFAAIYDVMNGRAKFNNRGSKETFSPAEVGRLQRCLMVLCFLCEFSSICRNQLVDFASYFDVMRSDSSSILKATIEASAQPNIAVAELPLHQIPYLHPNVLHGSTYSAALCILSKAEDSNVQLQAVQALCGVFTGCPRLMILANEKNILPTLLGNTFESRVHERFLLALKDMLVNEEARSEKNAALNLMKESGVAVTSVRDGVLGNPEHDSDATIAGFQLQQHLAALLAFLGDKNASMRYTTLLLIGTLLRQGMLCPLDVIGELVALVADDVDDIREEALRMLQIEDEKHPNFLDNRITEGVERSFLQQCRIRLEENQFRPSSEDILQLATIDNLTFNSLLSTGGNDGGRSSQWVSRFGALYVTCIQPIKKRRNEFLFSLLRRCYQLFDFLIDEVCNHHSSYTSMQSKGNRNGRESDLEVSNENNQVRGSKRMKRLLPTKRSSAEAAQLMSEVPSAERNRNTAYFLCTTVAYLPFTSVEEPLQVIYFLNRNIPVATSLQLQQLKFQLISMGCEFRKEGSMQPPVLGTHPVMPAQSNESDKPVREIQEADILVNESAFRTWLSATADKDLSALYVQVCELVLKALKLRSLEALLRLKAFLKVGYQLSDDRCSAFNPDDKNSSVSGEASNEKLTGEDLPLFNAAPKTAPTLDEFFSDKFQTMLTKRGQENLSALQSALLGLVRSVCIDFNRISCLLVNDPEDFTYSGGNTTKRVRKASANRASTGSSNATRKGRSTKPHKKRKRFDMDSDDDDDLDDDDNYIGGGNGDEDYVAQTSRKAAKMDAAVRHGATSVASPQRRKAATAALSNVKRFMEEDGDVYERDIDGSGGAAANDIDADEDEDEGEGYF